MTAFELSPLLFILILSKLLLSNQNIIMSHFITGFTFLFVTMIPVPREVKIAFHVFGLANFCTGLAQCISTLKGKDCVSYASW